MAEQIKLLIVDDEVRFLDSIAHRLELRDFDVTKASSGTEAIKAAEGGGFDLALLDLKMPGMNGQEVLQILKRQHQFLEVIILTGHGSFDSAVECTKLGAFSYLSKPYELEKLLEVLKQAYEVRLKKKFLSDQQRIAQIEAISAQADPQTLVTQIRKQMAEKPTLLSILRELRKLDDERK
ncbi:MAG: response regulator [Acidobacteriota bacterium]|nr:MAG: response regulator [Acidobacteriota bacterium]